MMDLSGLSESNKEKGPSQKVKKQSSQEVKKLAKRARIMESDEEMNDNENVENNMAKEPGMHKFLLVYWYIKQR